MTDAISSIQTAILGWATPLQTAIIAVLTGFLVITGIFLTARLLLKAANRAAK